MPWISAPLDFGDFWTMSAVSVPAAESPFIFPATARGFQGVARERSPFFCGIMRDSSLNGFGLCLHQRHSYIYHSLVFPWMAC